jgi:dienelactone hydrolase
MDNAFKEHGLEGRNKVQLQQLETDQLQDMISGLKFLLERKEVDTNRIAIMGHSFGGGLTLLVAEQDSHLKAIVIFAPTGYSWDRSPILRQKLIRAVKSINAPIMIIHAQNDYSTNPGNAMDSVLKQLDKPHLLKIYPRFGISVVEGHALLFLSTETRRQMFLSFLKQPQELIMRYDMKWTV